jgi:large subunit ribosomal protein L16
MLNPKKTKFRRHHRGNRKGIASKGNQIQFGCYALQAIESAWLTSRQIEAGRRTISRYTKRGGKLWIRVFPDRSITARPAETRMGSGKGAPHYWIANIQPGRIVYEVNGITNTVAEKAMMMASYKMPMKTKIIFK